MRLLITPSSPIEDWLERANARPSDDASATVVCSLERADEVDPSSPHIVVLPHVGDGFVAEPLLERSRSVRADGYASCASSLAQALAFVSREDRAERSLGPRRLVWLGPLGTTQPFGAGPIGTAFPIAPGFAIGRSDGCTVCLRQGAHSDQNLVARRHADLEPTTTGALLRDRATTNGTYLRGAMIREAHLVSGDEIDIAGGLRFRLDGDSA